MSSTERPPLRSIVTDDEFGGFRVISCAPEGDFLRGWIALSLSFAFSILCLIAMGIDPKPHRGLSNQSFWLATSFCWLCLNVLGICGTYTYREIFMIDGKALILRRECWGLRLEQVFELSEVRNLSPRLPAEIKAERRKKKRLVHSLTFDHAGKAHNFGLDISEYEARRIVKTVLMKYPIGIDSEEDVDPLPIQT